MKNERSIANNARFSGRPPRIGAVLICVLVCIAVVAMLLAGMIRNTLMTRRQLRTEQHARQAAWLVQAGAERAAFQLAKDSKYEGESWGLEPGEIVGSHPGQINITVDQLSSERVIATVVAEYPSGEITSVKRSHEFKINLSQKQ